MKVSYQNLMHAIISGIISNNEDKVIGQMLLQTETPLSELLDNSNESVQKIYSFLEPTAFSVLKNLQNTLGEELEITDENGAVISLEEE